MDRDRDGRGRRQDGSLINAIEEGLTLLRLTDLPRYDDGEIIRYGAGESWRPTPRGADRSPRRARSPARERIRSPRPRSPRPRSPRPRSPVMVASDSYVPGRYHARRRSRSAGGSGGGGAVDRYRREGEALRRRERSRSQFRRSPPRRSPSRRLSPLRDGRHDRPRSPRRDWHVDRDRDRERLWDRDRDRDNLRRDDRRRSRSPALRDRRERSPLGRATGLPPKSASYRPATQSPSRRGDRFQSYRRPSPPRESDLSSARTSRPVSEKASSPQLNPARLRSPPPVRDEVHHSVTVSGLAQNRDLQRPAPPDASNAAAVKSPPRGPAALRAPPSGPASSRGGNPTPAASRSAQTAAAASHRSDITSPTIPPAGPRGYVVPERGSFSSRSGRSGWSQPPSRQSSGPSLSPAAAASIPTGPRNTSANLSYSSTSAQPLRSFNPPTGPSSQHGGGQRQTMAQNLLASMPPLVPGGKLDPSMTSLTLGVTKDRETHMRKLRDEEEKLRDELRAKEEKLRKSLYVWDKLERESKLCQLRSDLSEKSMKNLAGEGIGGAAF